MKKYSPQQVLQILEMDYPIIQLLGQCRSFEQGAACLDKFKKEVGVQRKRLAKKYHPDLNGGSGERMKQINDACDFVKILRLMKPQPQPEVIFYYYEGSNSTTANSYTTYF